MRRLSSLLRVAVATLVPTSAGAAVDVVLDIENELVAAPFAATRAVALKNQVPLQGYASWTERDRLATGDSVTLLVTESSTPARRQWLITITAESNSVASRRDDSSDDVRLFTNTGHEIRYANDPATLAMRIWGPFADTPTDKNESPQFPASEEARDAVNENFLRLGFAQACDAMMRLHRARTDGRLAPDIMFSVGIKPFPPPELAEGMQLVDAAGFSLEDERAIAGTVPALMEFFDIASRAPGLRGLVWELLKKPSIWSVISRIGRVDSGVRFHANEVSAIAAEPWGLPASTSVFQIPFTLELNDKPGLLCALAVTQPRPPLLVSAGILGLSVQSPQDDGKHIFLRVIAARTAQTGGPDD